LRYESQCAHWRLVCKRQKYQCSHWYFDGAGLLCRLGHGGRNSGTAQSGGRAGGRPERRHTFCGNRAPGAPSPIAHPVRSVEPGESGKPSQDVQSPGRKEDRRAAGSRQERVRGRRAAGEGGERYTTTLSPRALCLVPTLSIPAKIDKNLYTCTARVFVVKSI